MKSKKKKGKWLFLLIVGAIYLTTLIYSRENFIPIFKMFMTLIKQIAPIFMLVYILMVLINYFINNEILKKYMGEESGVKGWVISIVAGIISMGPVFMWYPLMKDLQKSGVKNRYLATFLYNRGIKLQWLPMLILYFGWKYSLTLLIVMALLSIPQGILTEKLMGK